MKTLEEHNRDARRAHFGETRFKPNGIECPSCKSELVDSGGGQMLSSPPQQSVHCEQCGFKGSRVC